MGIGEATRRLTAKLVHTLTTTQAMEACGTNNLCGRLKAVNGIFKLTYPGKFIWKFLLVQFSTLEPDGVDCALSLKMDMARGRRKRSRGVKKRGAADVATALTSD